MKKRTSIILGITIPAVAIAAAVPTVLLLTKKPTQPTEDTDIDISEVEKDSYSVIERNYDKGGYSYLYNIKINKGSYKSLKAELVNVSGLTESTTYEAKIVEGYTENTCMVQVHFDSDDLIVRNSPKFDVKITNAKGKEWILEGCTSVFTFEAITLRASELKSNQTFYSSKTETSKTFFIRGYISGMVRTWYNSRSITDWSGFKISAKILTPSSKATISAKLVKQWSQMHILATVDNITNETETLSVQFTITQDEIPDWSWEFGPVSITIKTNTQDVPFKFEVNDDTKEATVTDVYSIDDEITIPDTYTKGETTYDVTTIGSYALSSYINLKTLHLPSKLTTIKDYAFSKCYYLDKLEIPASVKTIEDDAFEDCYSISNLTVAEDNANFSSKINGKESNCLLDKAGTKLLFGFTKTAIPEGITELGSKCFKDSICLTDITIPKSITAMGDYVFYKSSVQSITIEEGSPITSLGDDFAADCESLKTLNFNSNLQKFGRRCFSGSTGLEEFTVPDSVYSAGQWCFDGCTNLKKVNIGKGLWGISGETFQNCPNIEEFNVSSENGSLSTKYDGKEYHALIGGKTLIKATPSCTEIPNGITQIADFAFENRTGLTKITIPDTVTEIGEGAFQGCIGLKEIKIGNKVERINFKAFNGCSNLKEVTIPASCNYIWNLAFQNCYALEKVVFEDGCTLKELPYCCFEDCISLKEVKLPSALEKMSSNTFNDCMSLESITLPSTLTEMGNSEFGGCTSLKEITIPKSVKVIDSSTFSECVSLTSVKFEEGSVLETLDGSVFENCIILDNIEIPAGVTELKWDCFKGCRSLTNITFKGTSITEIGENCFENCTALETIKLPDSVETIGEYAFTGCSSLKNVTLPSALTTIDVFAFSECSSLESITIPDNVTVIGTYAFKDCTRLTSATFKVNTGWYYNGLTAADVSTPALAAEVLLEEYALIKR